MKTNDREPTTLRTNNLKIIGETGVLHFFAQKRNFDQEVELQRHLAIRLHRILELMET